MICLRADQSLAGSVGRVCDENMDKLSASSWKTQVVSVFVLLTLLWIRSLMNLSSVASYAEKARMDAFKLIFETNDMLKGVDARGAECGKDCGQKVLQDWMQNAADMRAGNGGIGAVCTVPDPSCDSVCLTMRPCEDAFRAIPSVWKSFSEGNSSNSADFQSYLVDRGLLTVRIGQQLHGTAPLKVIDRKSPPEETTFYRSMQNDIDSLVDYALTFGQGQLTISVINNNFVKFANNWLCNVQLLNVAPPPVVWIATEKKAYEAMRAKNRTAFYFGNLRGAENGQRGQEFGSPGYWELMLNRARLVRELLDRGISVMLFDADQVWLRDPMSIIRDELQDPEVDVVGTVVSLDEVGGNFLHFRPSRRTRKMYHALCDEFETDYAKYKLGERNSTFSRSIRNDQTILSSFLVKNEKWKEVFRCRLGTLDRDRFVDGRWYEGKYPHRKDPIVINNNYKKSQTKKIDRAKKAGHWFVQDDGSCVLPDRIQGLTAA